MSWKLYGVSTESPESLVEKLLSALGIAARRWPFLYMSSERSFAVASFNRRPFKRDRSLGDVADLEIIVCMTRISDSKEFRTSSCAFSESDIQTSLGHLLEAIRTPGLASAPERRFDGLQY